MTSPHARHPLVMARPACTPAAIRAVLAANADAGLALSAIRGKGHHPPKTA